MVHKVTGTICTMRPTIVACDVAGCRHHVASTLLWSTASETIRILDDLSLAVFFNSCDTRTKNINLLYLTPFPITSLHNLIHAVYLNFLYLPLFTAWRLCVDLATCLYFVLYRPMFIIIHCYLVLHHKYEINVICRLSFWVVQPVWQPAVGLYMIQPVVKLVFDNRFDNRLHHVGLNVALGIELGLRLGLVLWLGLALEQAGWW